MHGIVTLDQHGCVHGCVHGDASFHQGRCGDGSMQCPHPIKSYLGRARVSKQN